MLLVEALSHRAALGPIPAEGDLVLEKGSGHEPLSYPGHTHTQDPLSL